MSNVTLPEANDHQALKAGEDTHLAVKNIHKEPWFLQDNEVTTFIILSILNQEILEDIRVEKMKKGARNVKNTKLTE